MSQQAIESDPGWPYLRRTREQQLQATHFPYFLIRPLESKLLYHYHNFRINRSPMTRRRIAGSPMPKKATLKVKSRDPALRPTSSSSKSPTKKYGHSPLKFFETIILPGDPEKGPRSRGESSEVREDRRHVQPDLPQRRVCASQSQSSLWSYAHLRKTVFYLITFYLITFVQLFLPIFIPLKSPHWISV